MKIELDLMGYVKGVERRKLPEVGETMCFPIGEDSRHILCEVKGTIAGGKVATVYLEKIDPCEVDDRRLSEDGWRRPAPSQGEGWGWPGG